MTEPSSSSRDPLEHFPVKGVQKLKKWLGISFLLFGSLVVSVFVYVGVLMGAGDNVEQVFVALIMGIVLAYLISYFNAMVCAYQVQKDFNEHELLSHGAWQIVVAALVLNPFLIGLWVPFSVLLSARKIRRHLEARAR